MEAVIGFVILFLAFQAREAIGQRLLDSFAWQSALLLAFFVAAYVVGRWRSRCALDAFALRPWRGHGSLAIGLFVAAVCARLAALTIGLQIGLYEGGDAMLTSTAKITGALAVAALMTCVPAIAEDMLTRGYIFRARDGRWPLGSFVAVSAFVYTANNIFRLALGPSEWLMLLVFGAVYALALARTGSLWPAIGLHWGWNYANSAVDRIWAIDAVSPAGTRLLSSAAHLVLGGVVWLLTSGASAGAGEDKSCAGRD